MRSPPASYFLAEWYITELDPGNVDHATAALQRAATTVSDTVAAVSVLSVMAAPTDDLLYALFAASGPHLVTQTCRAAGMPVDRLTADIYVRILTQPAREGCT